MATLLIQKMWRKSAVPLMLKDGPCSRAMWDFFFPGFIQGSRLFFFRKAALILAI